MARRRGLRALGWFWAILLLAAAGGAATLQWLGPPPPASVPAPGSPTGPVAPQASVAGPAAAPLAAPLAAPPAASAPPAAPVAEEAAGRRVPGPIPPPDPALEGPAPDFPGAMLPRRANDGRAPMQFYAAYADPAEQRPRVAVLLAGLGMNQADSLAAIRDLPAAVSLSVSPYAADPAPLLAAARAAGHEVLLGIPMEPQGYPLNDEGSEALLTSLPEQENMRRLEWSLSRLRGYAGATAALGALRGERFAGAPELMGPVLHDLAARGLFYIDPRPGAPPPPGVVGRSADVNLDATASGGVEAALERLARHAREHGSALGIIAITPAATEALAVWAHSLDAGQIALVPVSALAAAPKTASPTTKAATP